MVRAASHGTKVPLSIIGKPKKPVCFSLAEGGKPLLLCNQARAWLDKKRCNLVGHHSIWPFHLCTQGNVEAALVLDNCAAHNIDISDTPDKLLLIFSPPNVTSAHQEPADAGLIASLKVDHERELLAKVPPIFDTNAHPKNEAEFGGKPHLLDAVTTAHHSWEGDQKHAAMSGIKSC